MSSRPALVTAGAVRTRGAGGCTTSTNSATTRTRSASAAARTSQGREVGVDRLKGDGSVVPSVAGGRLLAPVVALDGVALAGLRIDGVAQCGEDDTALAGAGDGSCEEALRVSPAPSIARRRGRRTCRAGVGGPDDRTARAGSGFQWFVERPRGRGRGGKARTDLIEATPVGLLPAETAARMEAASPGRAPARGGGSQAGGAPSGNNRSTSTAGCRRFCGRIPGSAGSRRGQDSAGSSTAT